MSITGFTMIVCLVVVLYLMGSSAGDSTSTKRRSSRYAELREFEFPGVVQAVFEREHPYYTEEQRRIAFQGLREYFCLMFLEKAAGRKESLGMPSVLVDDAWHCFVLCTREYEAFCLHFFGAMVHHFPDPEVRARPMLGGMTVKADVQRTWLATQRYRSQCTELAWAGAATAPLLFAADSYAGISEGWLWSPEALAGLEVTTKALLAKEAASRSSSGSSCGGVVADAGGDGGSSGDGGCGGSCGGGGGCGGC